MASALAIALNGAVAEHVGADRTRYQIVDKRYLRQLVLAKRDSQAVCSEAGSELGLVGEDRGRVVVGSEVQAQLAVDDVDVDRVAGDDVASGREGGDRDLPVGFECLGVEQRDAAELEAAVLR